METLRTPEELNNPDYNYYFAYAIDSAEKDAKKIETAMAIRKCSFTQGTFIQRRLQDLYTEAVKIMTDNVLREEEFQVAKKIKLETAEKMAVAIVRGRGTIYKSDLIKMADASGKWLTVDEIEKKIAYLLQQGAKLVDDTKRSLDFLAYDKIEKLLKTIGKGSLYDLLGVVQSASISTLQGAVTTTFNTTVSGERNPKSNATTQICGEAKKIFKDDNSKKYYDIYLATKDIWNEFALRRSCGITELEFKEFLDYSEKAKNALKIFDVDYIESLLAEGLNYFRIAVVGREQTVLAGKADTIKICNTGGFIEKCTKTFGLLSVRYDGVKIISNIIFKDTTKPIHEEREFSTLRANQIAINLQVYENNSPKEEANIDESTPIYESCEIRLTPGLPKGAKIQVNFDLDTNGVLAISAIDLTNNVPLIVSTVCIGEETSVNTQFDTIIKKINNSLVQLGVSVTEVQAEFDNLKKLSGKIKD